jgi:hypothetical protein
MLTTLLVITTLTANLTTASWGSEYGMIEKHAQETCERARIGQHTDGYKYISEMRSTQASNWHTQFIVHELLNDMAFDLVESHKLQSCNSAIALDYSNLVAVWRWMMIDDCLRPLLKMYATLAPLDMHLAAIQVENTSRRCWTSIHSCVKAHHECRQFLQT